MADQNITELPVKTSSGITSSDYMLGIDSAEGYQMLIRDLGDYIIRNVQVNTIAGANQTLKSALDTLNSKVGTFRLQFFTIAGGSTKTFNVPINGRYIVMTTAYSDPLKGLFILHSISNGATTITLVGGDPTNLTTSGGQNQFSITNNATVSTEVYILTMDGNAITI